MATAPADLITTALILPTLQELKDHHALILHLTHRAIRVVHQVVAPGAVAEAVVVEAPAAGQAADNNNQQLNVLLL